MAWDKVWEEVFCRQEWGKYPNEDLIRFVARNYYRVNDRRSVRLLEVGCGPGANLWYMAREGFCAYGIDGSAAAIAQAKRRLDKEVPGWCGELLVGDIIDLPFAANHFDAVLDNEAIYCNSYEDSKAIYAELARVTKPGGKLFSRTLATGCWGDRTGCNVGHNAWIVAAGPAHGKGYTRFTDYDEIADLIGGFAIEEIELLTRTADNRRQAVKEWLIVGRKQAE